MLVGLREKTDIIGHRKQIYIIFSRQNVERLDDGIDIPGDLDKAEGQAETNEKCSRNTGRGETRLMTLHLRSTF